MVFKKALVLVLSVIMAFTFVACGTGNNNTSAPPTSTKPADVNLGVVMDITGALSGSYLSSTAMGAFSGPFYGTYDEHTAGAGYGGYRWYKARHPRAATPAPDPLRPNTGPR